MKRRSEAQLLSLAAANRTRLSRGGVSTSDMAIRAEQAVPDNQLVVADDAMQVGQRA